jgi:hypothetical protein
MSQSDPRPTSVEALGIIERYSDGSATGAELSYAYKFLTWEALDRVLTAAFDLVAHYAATFFNCLEGIPAVVLDAFDELQRSEIAVADLLRDIFGNPFSHATFDPLLRTSTATAIAKQMYDTREFSAMPILADALEDAGCDSEDILNHCREAQQVHVRGCWVVDLVLGLS